MKELLNTRERPSSFSVFDASKLREGRARPNLVLATGALRLRRLIVYLTTTGSPIGASENDGKTTILILYIKITGVTNSYWIDYFIQPLRVAHTRHPSVLQTHGASSTSFNLLSPLVYYNQLNSSKQRSWFITLALEHLIEWVRRARNQMEQSDMRDWEGPRKGGTESWTNDDQKEIIGGECLLPSFFCHSLLLWGKNSTSLATSVHRIIRLILN